MIFLRHTEAYGTQYYNGIRFQDDYGNAIAEQGDLEMKQWQEYERGEDEYICGVYGKMQTYAGIVQVGLVSTIETTLFDL